MDENATKGKKRAATRQLTQDEDPDKFVDSKEPRGPMPEAPPEVLQQRRIIHVTGRKSRPNAAPSASLSPSSSPGALTPTAPTPVSSSASEKDTADAKLTKPSKDNDKVAETKVGFKFASDVAATEKTAPPFSFSFNFAASEEKSADGTKAVQSILQPPSFQFDFKPSFDFSALSKGTEKRQGGSALPSLTSSLVTDDSKRDVQSVFKLTVEQTKVLGENIAPPSQSSEHSDTVNLSSSPVAAASSPTSSTSETPVSATEPLITGEENEECLLEVDAKLYEFVKDSTKDGEPEPPVPTQSWRERGAGRLRLLVLRSDKQKSRLVMRHARTHKLLLNTFIFAHMSVSLKHDKLIYFNTYSTPNTPVFYSLRLKTPADAQKLLEAIQKQRDAAKERMTSVIKDQSEGEKQLSTEAQTAETAPSLPPTSTTAPSLPPTSTTAPTTTTTTTAPTTTTTSTTAPTTTTTSTTAPTTTTTTTAPTTTTTSTTAPTTTNTTTTAPTTTNTTTTAPTTTTTTTVEPQNNDISAK